MTLKGEARTKYMREYMRRKRAGDRTAPAGGKVRPTEATESLEARIKELEARIKELEAALASERKRHVATPVSNGDEVQVAPTLPWRVAPKKTMSPEAKAKAQSQAKARRELNAKIKAAYEKEREFEATKGRKLKKIEAIAADQRGEANTPSVAENMAEKLRHSKPSNPYRPPPLPEKLTDWDKLKRKAAEARRAKRAASRS